MEEGTSPVDSQQVLLQGDNPPTKRSRHNVSSSETLTPKPKFDSFADRHRIRSYSVDIGDDITFHIYTNDGKDDSVIALVALKNIFSRQLPKMPREYIVRLVFDHRHISLAILKRGRIIGGICYRPYYEQRFAEIAFCAINGTEQVRGYGTMLMNHLKTHVQRDKLEYFLTYADNFAIGYFQKQGFSKNCAMPKERWVGFIKDYDGGTLMECYIHPAMDYLNVQGVVALQRAYIYQRIRERSESDAIYPGLEIFREGKRLASLADAPGVLLAGWTANQIYKGSTERDRNNTQSKLTVALASSLDRIKSSSCKWAFEKPVSARDFPDYSVKIMNPVDLQTITTRLKLDYYRCKEMMVTDLMLMVSNCKQFHPKKDSDYHMAADQMEKLIMELFGEKESTSLSSSSDSTAKAKDE